MFNQELKKKFIRDRILSIATIKFYEFLFEATSVIEERYQLDLCQMNKQQLDEVVTHAAGISRRSQNQAICTLREYARWCVAHEIPGATLAACELYTKAAEKIRKTYVSGPESLQMYLDQLFEKEIEYTTGNIKRAAHWLAFSGVYESDSASIRRKDVLVDSRRIVYGNTMLPMYEQSVPAFQHVKNAREYVIIRESYNTGRGYFDVSWLTPNSQLLYFPKSKSTTQDIAKIISMARVIEGRKGRTTDLHLSYRRIWQSGLFYRMLQDERSGKKEADFTDVAILIASKKISDRKDSEVVADNDPINKLVSRYKSDYLNLYRDWKEVFW